MLIFACEQARLLPHKLCDLAGDGTGVAAAQCLFDDLLGVVALLRGETGADHRLVGAWLALSGRHAGEGLLGFVEVLLQSPAVNESVGDVWCVLDVACAHICEQA